MGTRIGLLSTEFGYGPASKIVAIASALVDEMPSVDLTYYGSGSDLSFVGSNAPFIDLIATDPASEFTAFRRSAERLDAVVNCMNFAVMKRWEDALPPMYLVDSLAWMWPAIPACVSLAARYFVQRYLVGTERFALLSRQCPNAEFVGPVILRGTGGTLGQQPRTAPPILNLSGCVNPFLSQALYMRYAVALAQAFAETLNGCPGLVCINEVYHAEGGASRGLSVK